MTRTRDHRSDDAACEGADTEIFFATDGEGATSAKFGKHVIDTYCSTCPVKQQCLDDALRVEGGQGARFGIRGGLTSSNRTRLAAKLRKEAAA